MMSFPIKKLTEVSEIVNGGTPKTKIAEYWDGDIKWITPKDLGQLESIYANDTPRKIAELGLEKSSAKIIPSHSVILSTRAPIGHLAINTVPMAFNQGCRGIIPGEDLDTKYLYYFLYKSVELLNRLGTGATFKELSARALKGVDIPFPPLPEQQRIVEILDEAFEAIDQAKANVERNIQNAEELFQSKLNEVFSQSGEGWEVKKLGELTYVKSGGTPRKSNEEYWNNGTIPWYSSGELNDLYTKEPKDFITEKGLAESNAKLFPKGSLLIGMYDTAALKMSILDRDGTFNQAVSGVQPHKSLNLQFVMLAINAIKPELMKQRRGVRQKNLNLSKIKSISVPFPKVEIQNEVVSHLTEVRDYTNTLKEMNHKKLFNLEKLKKSILRKAFSGKLTGGEAGFAGLEDEQDELVAKAAEPEVEYGAEG